jgi:glycosyltransferase involved in cell wall biosynthesis
MRLTVPRPWTIPSGAPKSLRAVSVSFVIDRLSHAGTESQLLALLRHLDRDRVRPSLCLLDGREPLSQSLKPDDCPVLDLGIKRLISPAAAIAASKLARFWRRQRVDVVVTYFLDSTYFAVPLARLCGIRRVVRVRNNDGYWLTPTHRRLGRVMGRLCHLTLTNSTIGRQSLIAAEGLAEDRVHVLENGVDVDRFAAAKPPDTSRPVVRIGALANLRPVKNIDGLIRVAAAICRSDPRVQFEVAGKGDERAAFEGQIRAAGLDGRFRLRGAVADVPGFLANLDIAVLCSHSESMSNALLEYMAAGRAIVATDVGANARVIRDGIDGLIVPPGNDAALQGAIVELLQQPAVARALAASARTRAAAEFSRQTMVRRFEDFFLSLMKR